ncbi:ATP-binding protein [Rossellomorea sp. SC111]|uniref:HD domain-containing protein n=1 Tax=Rossellomorea sp. SC111 TaxID=2968985 RepID=UPI00215ACE00|nr:ATP-binding protein [Rossellomorea sp. SC111]MCR8847789.1 ATP-binding protein [Rossellomorea sp. SC111]
MQILALDSVQIISLLKERNTDFYNGLIKVYRKVEPLLNTRISQVFPSYTLHDINHSLRIMDYMGKLVPDLNRLNDFELALLAFSALLHDIGMAATDKEVKGIKNGELSYSEIEYDAVLKKFNGDEEQAIQDYIRRVHAFRSAEFVKRFLKDDLIIPNMFNTTFEDQIALICQSHTEDISWIKQNLDTYGQKGEYTYNPQFCSIILRLADILDFDSQRTPPSLFESIRPQGISKAEWVQHFSIENTEKIKHVENDFKVIELHGRCSNPFIHRKILSYINWINAEINNANDLTQGFSKKYRLLLHPKVYNFIKSEGYTIADMKFKVNYDQLTKLLMGQQLYGEKKHGLRELIQNSIDACKLKKEIINKNKQFGDEEYNPEIRITLDKKNNTVTIKDNGIGMNLHVLKNYFLKLGASFYKSDDYTLKGFRYKPIGNYGIGFLACFMLSDVVKVRTRHMNEPELFEVDLSKYDEFVCINHHTAVQNQGTEVTLSYNQFMDCWENLDTLKKFLNSHFLTDEINIIYINIDEEVIEKIDHQFFRHEGKQFVNLSKYFNGIDAQVNLVQNNFDYIFESSIEDIQYKGEPFIYDGESLIPLDENEGKFQLLDFLHDNKLTVLNFPIIADGEELDKIFELIDDSEDAKDLYIEKNDPKYMTIIAKRELMDDAPEGFLNHGNSIFPDLNLDDLEGYGHDYSAGSFFEIEEKIIFNIDNNRVFLPINSTKYLKYSVINRENFDLFVRNVFVKKFSLDIPFILLNLSIKELNINIKNEEVIPNVTRNDLSQNDLIEIKYAIYQALCLHLYENQKDVLKKQTILGYVKKYHQQKTKFIKSEYGNLFK